MKYHAIPHFQIDRTCSSQLSCLTLEIWNYFWYLQTLAEIAKTTDPHSSFHGENGRLNLVHTLFDVFLAGSETTSTTLTWAMLYMARYPEVQIKVQKELDLVVGHERMPSLRDRPDLPYTEAVIMEIQRYANIVPQGVQHVVQKEVTVNGLTLPIGAMVMPLMKELLQGSYWDNGETFRPERFLDSDGKCRKDDHLIPFSIGESRILQTLNQSDRKTPVPWWDSCKSWTLPLLHRDVAAFPDQPSGGWSTSVWGLYLFRNVLGREGGFLQNLSVKGVPQPPAYGQK